MTILAKNLSEISCLKLFLETFAGLLFSVVIEPKTCRGLDFHGGSHKLEHKFISREVDAERAAFCQVALRGVDQVRNS